MSDIVKWKPNLEIDRVVERAIELLNPVARREPVVVNNPPDGPLVPRTTTLAAPIALPRVCGMNGRPYVAYYVERNGRHRHSQTGLVNQQVYRASFLQTRSSASVAPGHTEDEACPYCGVSGKPIICGGCKNWVCRNRVVDNFFTCVLCGASGQIGIYKGAHTGVAME
jgi:hypothetical protein